jgi:hypothetical protein
MPNSSAAVPIWLITIIVATFTMGAAALLLWVRDRWWDQEGVSAAKRERYQQKLRRGNAWLSTVFEFTVAVAFLVKAIQRGQIGHYMTYGLLGLLFLWLGYRHWVSTKDDQSQKEHSPSGTPPPIE